MTTILLSNILKLYQDFSQIPKKFQKFIKELVLPESLNNTK